MANPKPSPSTRFKPGRSGNPGGRPRDVLTAVLRRQLTPEDAEAIMATLVAEAKAGNLKALEIIYDRLEGKAVQRNEHGEPGDFELTLDQARRVLQLDDHRPA